MEFWWNCAKKSRKKSSKFQESINPGNKAQYTQTFSLLLRRLKNIAQLFTTKILTSIHSGSEFFKKQLAQVALFNKLFYF